MPVSFGKYGEVREIGEVTPENWPGGDYNKVGMKVKKHRIKFIDGDMVCTDPKEGSEITIEEIKDLKTFLQGIRWMLDGDEDLMLSVLRNGVDSEVEGFKSLSYWDDIYAKTSRQTLDAIKILGDIAECEILDLLLSGIFNVRQSEDESKIRKLDEALVKRDEIKNRELEVLDDSDIEILRENIKELREMVFEEQKITGPLVNIPVNKYQSQEHIETDIVSEILGACGGNCGLNFEGRVVTKEMFKNMNPWTDEATSFLNGGDINKFSPVCVPSRSSIQTGRAPSKRKKPKNELHTWYDRKANEIKKAEMALQVIFGDINDVLNKVKYDKTATNEEKLEVVEKLLEIECHKNLHLNSGPLVKLLDLSLHLPGDNEYYWSNIYLLKNILTKYQDELIAKIDIEKAELGD